MKFKDFPLHPQLLQNLHDQGFLECSDVQSQSLQPIIDRHNVIAGAPTGTGKTLAFLVPTIHNLVIDQAKFFACLILVPTRELAIQIHQEITKITRNLPIKAVAVYGQEPITKQNDRLKKLKPQIVVATCGRLLDHMTKGALNISNVRTIILDEADEMLKMGFREDINQIIFHHPRFDQVQKLLFSATINDKVHSFAEEIIDHAQYISASKRLEIVGTIDQYYIEVEENDKIILLEHLLNQYSQEKIIIFINRKTYIEQVAKQLCHYTYQIHGDLRQYERNQIIKYFKTSKRAILLASDVAARGLDINDVDLVINFNYPPEDEFYVHRIGRSGRNHKKGLAITFISNQYERIQLLNLIKNNQRTQPDTCHEYR